MLVEEVMTMNIKIKQLFLILWKGVGFAGIILLFCVLTTRMKNEGCCAAAVFFCLAECTIDVRNLITVLLYSSSGCIDQMSKDKPLCTRCLYLNCTHSRGSYLVTCD